MQPSLSQAVRLKKMKQKGSLTIDSIRAMLSETKKTANGEPSVSKRFQKFFPADYSQKQMDAVIIELLKDWKSKATE